MFRKRLFVLVVASLVALAAVTGYSWLNFSGPQQAIDKARSLIEQEQYAQAITELDSVERGSTARNDHSLREEVWRLRYHANAKFGNADGALRDVENLLRAGTRDEKLLLDQIRLTTALGNGERALVLATTFLEQHPDHGRALELAGEACQQTWGPSVAELEKRIERDLSSTHLPRAREALGAWLYCPDRDESVATSLATLQTLYDSEPRLAAAWQGLLPELRGQREAVQRGQRYFQRSLEAGGEPVTAFLGFAEALAQSGRIDDLQLACEIYRRRFDPARADAAAASAAWALIGEGQHAAALAIANRWLEGGVQTRIERGTAGQALADLQVARAYAAWRAQDRDALVATMNDNTRLLRAGKHDPLAFHLAQGLTASLGEDTRPAEGELKVAVTGLAAKPRGRLDLLSELVPVQFDLLRARNAPDAELQALLTQWAARRPMDLQPRVRLAKFQLERNETAPALLTITDAEELDPDYDETFELRLEALRQHWRNSEQDGTALYLQCKQRGTDAPRVSDPVGFVLCAEAALAQKDWMVAAGSARMAVDAFPQARRPRLLEVSAYSLSGRRDDARRLVDRMLLVVKPDEETLLLALHVYRELEASTQPLLFSALRTCRPTPELHAELLRSALDTDRERAATFVTGAVRDAASPELRILAASALAHGGEPRECEPWFDDIAVHAEELHARHRVELAEALCAWLLATASQHDDAEHARAANRRLVQLHVDDAGAAPHLIAAAGELADTHPATALALVTHAMSIADDQARSGAAYALAGRLAVAVGSMRLAEDHWIAALAFEDGRSVAEDLARLSLALGRTDRAEQVYRCVEKPRDGALAACYGELELAVQIATANVARDAGDLLAHCTLAALGKPAKVDWQPAPLQLTRERLEVVGMIAADGLGSLALSRVQALVEQDPASWANQLLLARALAAAGRHPEAARVHGTLFGRGVKGPVFWREAAVLGAEPGYTTDPGLLLAVTDACARGECIDSPTTYAWGCGQLAQALEKSGNTPLAAAVRLTLWQRAPRAAKLSLADAEMIAAKLPPLEALALLGQALEGLDDDERLPVLELTVKLAADTLRQTPMPLPVVYTTVSAWADRYGPFGCLVHFLLDNAQAYSGVRPGDARGTALLLGHLRLVATGGDPAWLDRTIARLRTAQGTETTVSDLEDVLRQHPSALRLWQARAEALADLRRAKAGISDLRSVLAHAGPDATLPFATLAAAERALVPADAKLIEALPAAVKAGADAKFARGLVALRSGQPDDALALLDGAPPRADGLHLYATALALLQGRSADAVARARTVLETLARDYASSSLARNAGSFASQLGPR